MATATKRKQACSICGQSGHNRRTCARRQETTTKKTSNPKTAKKKPARKKPTKKVTKTTTHIALLLDNSASMSGIRDQAKNAFNQIVQTIKDGSEDQEVLVSVYTFGRVVRQEQYEVPTNILQPMNRYSPMEGRTALLKAVNTAVRDLKRADDTGEDSFLIQIVTDGMENAGGFTPQEIKKLIQECQGTDRWTFAVSCPKNALRYIEYNLGVHSGNIQVWDPSSRDGIQTVATGQTLGVQSYLAGRSRGVRATKQFFEVNVGRKSVSSVKKNLTPEPKKRFKRLKVDKARGIKDFIDSKGLEFKKGRVFYELQKPEIVQDYKEIVLQKRDDKKTFYGGTQVRDILGLPHVGEHRVSPGNLGEWVIWIQSTSSNRKLLAKMEVLFDTQN